MPYINKIKTKQYEKYVGIEPGAFLGSQVYLRGSKSGGCGLHHGVCATGSIGSEQTAWHWLIVRSDEAKEKLQECYDREWFKTAPMYIVGMKNVNENWVRRYDEKPHGDIDVAIAAEHLCLAATERGLGTCWVCNYDTDKMQQFFPREGFEAVVIIPLGHIAEDCPHAEKKRKEMNEIVEEI